MRRAHAVFVVCAAAAVLGAGVLAAGPARARHDQQDQPVFKAATRTVALYVTVTDADKRLVPGLTRNDFEIYDDKKPVPITLFDNETRPITVTVMLDTSGSMTLTLDLLKAAAEQFLMRLLPDDRAKVGAFNDKIQLLPDPGPFIGDRDELISIVRNDLQYGNPTRLWDAVNTCLDSLEGIEGRKVVLVFTDGDDTYSKASRGDVLKRAQRDDVMIYAIGLQSVYFNGQYRVRTKPDRGLKGLAEETGGGYFELTRAADLSSTFTRVAEELHSQYLMGFTPPVLDGKEHKVEVRVKKPGANARARKSYIASAGQ
jgi:Ca-activated chloride channel family protein